MSPSRMIKRAVPLIGAVAIAGLTFAGPATAAPSLSPVPPGSAGDTNNNGILDSSERPDRPDVP